MKFTSAVSILLTFFSLAAAFPTFSERRAALIARNAFAGVEGDNVGLSKRQGVPCGAPFFKDTEDSTIIDAVVARDLEKRQGVPCGAPFCKDDAEGSTATDAIVARDLEKRQWTPAGSPFGFWAEDSTNTEVEKSGSQGMIGFECKPGMLCCANGC